MVTGLQVDGSGRLSASASSEVTKVLANETAMLNLAAEPLRPYRVIRLDTNRLYFLNAGDSPSVLSNWFVGPSIDQVVLSFNNRTGAVVPEFGDYDTDLLKVVDKTSATTHKFVLDNGKLYLEEIATQQRVPVVDGSDLSSLSIQFNQLNDIVTNSSTGLQTRVSNLENTTATLSNTVNNPTTGLIAKVDTVNTKLTTLTNKDAELEDLILFVDKKVDSTAANTVVLDQRLQQVELDSRTQANRLSSKADLVGGKVPLYQLPNLPVGRKVTVANTAARLALSTYPDITIAYQQDTGDAWALNANANPSAAENWDKLGNAQATGVLSFNGRTGNISSEPNDYNTNQINETLDKFFVTPALKSAWDAKETTSGSQAKADAAATKATADAKAYADGAFIPASQKGVPNGIAPLGSAGKVPAANLLTNVAGGVPLLDGNAKVEITQLPTNTANGVPQLDGGGKVALAQLPVNVPGGIAPLGSAGKVPAANLLTNVTGGVPLLDANAKVPSIHLPSNLPSAKRIWRDNKSARNVGTYVTHNGGNGNEMMVYVRSTGSTATTREIRGTVRESSTGPSFTFQSTAFDMAGTRWIELYLHVPHGWQYAILSSGGTTDANIEKWYEMY